MESNLKLKLHQFHNGVILSSIKEIKEPIYEEIKLDLPELGDANFEKKKSKKGRKKKDV